MALYICSAIFCLIGWVLQIDGPVASGPFHGFYILGGVLFIISIITQGTMYANQWVCIEKIEENRANRKIYEEKDTVLTGECKAYLREAYPSIEKDIFNSMVSAKALLLNFPEINSYKTIMKLVDMINHNKDYIYSTDLAITSLIREIRARKRMACFWIYSPMIPNYIPKPEHK